MAPGSPSRPLLEIGFKMGRIRPLSLFVLKSGLPVSPATVLKVTDMLPERLEEEAGADRSPSPEVSTSSNLSTYAAYHPSRYPQR